MAAAQWICLPSGTSSTAQPAEPGATHRRDCEPASYAVNPAPAAEPRALLDEIRVVLRRDAASGAVSRRVGAREVGSDGELLDVILAQEAAFRAVGAGEEPVTIDAGARVPWAEVAWVLGLLKQHRIERVQVAGPGAVAGER